MDTVTVAETDDPSKAKATEDQVTVYQGEVTPDKDVKPRKVRSVDEVEKVKSSQEKADTTAEQPKQEPATGPARNRRPNPARERLPRRTRPESVTQRPGRMLKT